MAEPLLSVRDVTVRFGGVTALDGVSFDVHPGEILGLIGPNGAGKTTLLNLISGLVRPIRGDIRLLGRPIGGQAPWDIARAGIARTFQVVRPFESMSVVENVATGLMFGPPQLGVRQSLKEAEAILERVGLGHHCHSQVSDLTIADRKRLEVARALAMKPRLLLLDEVMAGLNLGEIDRVMDLVREVNHSGVTIIMIEHVMKAVMGISHRIVVLHYGRLLTTGSPHDVAADPKVIEAYLGHRFVHGASGAAAAARKVADPT